MIRLRMQGKEPIEGEHGVRIGRESAWADVVLRAEQVSRHHLEIRYEGDGYRAQDVGSRNGTTVNGRPLGLHGTALRQGDVIVLGDAIELTVEHLSAYDRGARTTVAGSTSEWLRIELHDDHFVVEQQRAGEHVRDTIPFQLGLALSLLALYQRDGFGPITDTEFRQVVWRGDPEQQVKGDINHLLHRLRRWFRKRDVEPPPVERPKNAASMRLQMPSSSVQIKPDAWLYRYLDRD